MSCDLVFSIFIFSVASLAMTILNKELTVQTKFPILLVSIQMIGACIVTPFFKIRFGKDWFIWLTNISPLIALMLISSMYAFKYVSIGSFVIMRNTLPLLTLFADYIINNIYPSKSKCFSLLFVGIGAITYSYGDIQFSSFGLCLLLTNMVICCIDRIREKQLLSIVDTNAMAMVFLNNVPGFIILLTVIMTDYHKMFHTLHKLNTPYNLSLVGLSIVCGIILNFSSTVLQRSISATTMVVVNCANKLVLILWGIVFHSDSTNLTCYIGIILSISGCVLYGVEWKKVDEGDEHLLKNSAS